MNLENLDPSNINLRRQLILDIHKLMSCSKLNDIASEVDLDLCNARFLTPHSLIELPEHQYNGIMDPTGMIILNVANDHRLINRSNIEKYILNNFVLPLCIGEEVSTVGAFSVITKMYGTILGVCRERIADIGLLDSDGNVRVTLAPKQETGVLEAQLTEISFVPGSTFLRAILILFSVVHYHPFTDGNGRAARTMFNFILRMGGLADGEYLPLFELMHRSRGGVRNCP